jgi:hypothetical protein
MHSRALAEPVSLFDIELGYPCYVPSSDQAAEKTIALAGRDIRAYVDLASTIRLSLHILSNGKAH